MQQTGLDRIAAMHLAETYGARAVGLLDRIARDTTGRLLQRVDAGLPFLWVEIEWAAEREMALSLEDIFVRRTGLFYRALDNGLAAAPQAATLLGTVLGWNAKRCEEEVARYTAFVATSRAWAGELPAARSKAS